MSSNLLPCILGLLVTAVFGHICILQPAQRGALSVTIPGDPSCYRREGPCGGTAAEEPKVVWTAGSTQLIKFQQNLNHWNPTQPGWLDVSISTTANVTGDDDFKVLATVDDFSPADMVTQTNFTVAIKVPATITSHAILRVRYVSQNPLERASPSDLHSVFYNCADVKIIAPVAVWPIQKECCTPKKWTATILSGLTSTTGSVYYDADAQTIKFIHPESQITTITPYRSGKEYVVFGSSSCKAYGPDQWTDWCYGPGSNHSLFVTSNGAKEVTFGSVDGHLQYDVRLLNDFDPICVPVAVRLDGKLLQTFYGHQVGEKSFNSSATFTPPSICPKTMTQKGCGN